MKLNYWILTSRSLLFLERQGSAFVLVLDSYCHMTHILKKSAFVLHTIPNYFLDPILVHSSRERVDLYGLWAPFLEHAFRVLLRERGSYIGLSNSVGTDRYYCGNCRHVMCSWVSRILSNNVGTDRYYCGNCRWLVQSNRVWISLRQSPTQP